MFFKKIVVVCCLLLTAGGFLCNLYSFSQIIDRIVAVVNNQVITLTDLRIAEGFGLYEGDLEGDKGSSLFLILERMVNQKVVLGSTRERISVSDSELQEVLDRVEKRLGPAELRRRLDEFGLSVDDLKRYFREKIIYQKILLRRFGQGVSVSLEEIEGFYRDVYVPSQKKESLQPKPMMQLLNEIEARIREKKIKTQISEWINNLKKQADIEIKSTGIDKQ